MRTVRNIILRYFQPQFGTHHRPISATRNQKKLDGINMTHTQATQMHHRRSPGRTPRHCCLKTRCNCYDARVNTKRLKRIRIRKVIKHKQQRMQNKQRMFGYAWLLCCFFSLRWAFGFGKRPISSQRLWMANLQTCAH